MRDYTGDYIRDIKGDTRSLSLDYGLYKQELLRGFQASAWDGLKLNP